MKTLSELVTDACNNHDILSILNVGSRERVVLCPLPQHVHKSNTPSFSIFWRGRKQYWRCHGQCDKQGDVVDLIGEMRISGYDKGNFDHIRQAVGLLDDRYDICIPQPEKEVRLAGGEWRQFVPIGKEALEFGATRGLKPEMLEKFRVGQSGHYMTLPCFEDGQLCGIKMRNLLECDKDRRFFQLEGSRMGLFNHDELYLRPRLAFIVKGEIPAMLLVQEGFSACAPTGGEGGWRGKLPKWTEALALSPKIVVGDNDGPGRIMAPKRAMMFGAKVFYPPEQFQDVDQWYLADPEHANFQLRAWEEQVTSTWW